MSQLDDDLDNYLTFDDDPVHDWVAFEDFQETLPLLRALIRKSQKKSKPLLLLKQVK
jgi:hypothetical protein